MHSIKELQTIFKESIQDFKLNDYPAGLNSPVNYIMGLGGKRVRPVLVLAACEAFEGDIHKAIKAALAIELFHNFTLMHDDIMDNASLRRGKETVHEKYDLNTAVLSGDVMVIYAYQLLQDLDSAIFKKIFNIFNLTAVQVCEGQRLDLNFETQEKVAIDEYIKMIEQKTAVLLGCSLKVGGFLAGTCDEDAEDLYEFGRNLGIAFQIQDDILDTFGDEKEFGKKIGGDILQNKKTYLLIRALEMSDNVQEETLMHCLNHIHSEEEKILKVKNIFNSLDVKRDAERAKQEYTEEAFNHLDRINIPMENKKVLYALANGLLNRNK